MADARDLSARAEIRFSGAGGQGILLAAAIVAEAATDLGKQVIQTQSYGPAARGGAPRVRSSSPTRRSTFPRCSRRT